jgi:hypothetical protein
MLMFPQPTLTKIYLARTGIAWFEPNLKYRAVVGFYL